MRLGIKMRALLLTGCLICVSVLLLFVIGAVWPQRRGSGLAVRFVGFTNAPSQPQSAVFVVTNCTRGKISFSVPQARVWSEAIVWLPSASGIFWLDAGQGSNVVVAVPKRGKVWRLGISWSYDQNEWERYVHRFKRMLRTAREGSLSGWNENRAYTPHIFTDFSADVDSTNAEPSGKAGTDSSEPLLPETNRMFSPQDGEDR